MLKMIITDMNFNIHLQVNVGMGTSTVHHKNDYKYKWLHQENASIILVYYDEDSNSGKFEGSKVAPAKQVKINRLRNCENCCSFIHTWHAH